MAIFIKELCKERISVYLKNGEIIEKIPANFENGKAVFQLPSKARQKSTELFSFPPECM